MTKEPLDLVGDIVQRLRLAERVCVLYGWTAAHAESEREKALSQAWQEWASIVGSEYTGPKAHPDLNDDEINRLAQLRDKIESQTKAAIEEMLSSSRASKSEGSE